MATIMSSLPCIRNHDAHGRLKNLGTGRDNAEASRNRLGRLLPKSLPIPSSRLQEKDNRSYEPIRGASLFRPDQPALFPSTLNSALTPYELASYKKANNCDPDGSLDLHSNGAQGKKRERRFVKTGDLEQNLQQVDERRGACKKVAVLTSPILIEGASKADRVGLEAIKGRDKKGAGQWKSLDFLYVAGDISSVPRTAYTFVDAILHKPDPPGIAALGLTSGISILTGGINVDKGYKQYKEAIKINDFWGKVSSVVTGIRGVFEASAGAVFVPVRLLSIAAAYTTAKSVTTAATILNHVGSGFFAVTFLLMALPSGIAIAKNISFTKRLEEAKNATENDTEAKKLRAGVFFLMKELGLKNEERKNGCDKVLNSPYAKLS